MKDNLSPPLQKVPGKNIEVLYIDDDKSFLRLVERLLAIVNPELHVETISNPDKALEKLEGNRFDCVLCDYKMPEMNGIEVLRKIRENYPKLPFIMLTSEGSEEVASQAISEDATDYIKKGGSRADYQIISNRIENAVSKKKAEEEREKAFERMADAYFKLDNKWRFTYTNENAAKILDRPRDQIIGENIWEIYPEVREDMKLYEKYHESMETQDTVSLEEYLPSQDRWVNIYVYPSEDGLSVYIRDITERIRHEQQLEHYQRIVNTAEEMLYLLDSEGKVEWINQEVADRLGYSREEMIGRDASDFVASAASRIEEIREKLEKGEKSPLIEAELLTSSGEVVVVEGRFTPYEFEDGEIGRMGVIREITERKDRERELEQREKALATITDGIYILDDDREFVFVNDAFTDITGYSREEIIGSTPALVADEETIPVMDKKQEELTDENTVGINEFELILADGTQLPVEIRFTPFQSEDIENGRIGVVRDITERKEREKRLERFGEIISHDLKNPLTTAQGSLELIRESVNEEDFEILEKSLQRIANMVDDLQLITLTSGEIEQEEISLENVCNEASRLSGVEASYDVEDMTFEAGRTSLIRLLANLIRNSVEHNEESVHIEVGPLKNENGFYYQDDGKGIPAEKREKVFEYGFTTSKTGSGLGLPIVKHIVEVNNWEIELSESETGGARFNISRKPAAEGVTERLTHP